MRALVTGSSGFIGVHVSRYLAQAGLEVVGFDQHEAAEKDFPTIVGDLRDLQALTAAATHADVIVHVGGVGDVYLATERPELAAEVNVAGSANVAIAAQRVGARIVYASTWEVYGLPDYEPVDELHPTRPLHPYNISKLAGEQMLLASDRLGDVPVISLRLGTVYGTGLRTNSVFRIFIDRARAGKPLVIEGDGAQSRQFTHVSDIAEAFLQACRATTLRQEVFNVVGTEWISIKELAEAVAATYPTELVFGVPRPGDISPAFVTSNKALEVLGWEAKVRFADGLAELMAT